MIKFLIGKWWGATDKGLSEMLAQDWSIGGSDLGKSLAKEMRSTPEPEAMAGMNVHFDGER